MALGRDAAIYMLSVTRKTTKTESLDFNSRYERSAGYDKPFLIVSNKNDQKKKAISDAEAASLAKGKDRYNILL